MESSSTDTATADEHGVARASPLQIGLASGVVGLVLGFTIGLFVGASSSDGERPAAPVASSQPGPVASQPPAAPPRRSGVRVDLGAEGAERRARGAWRPHDEIDQRTVAALDTEAAGVELGAPLQAGDFIAVVGRALGVDSGGSLKVSVRTADAELATWSFGDRWTLQALKAEAPVDSNRIEWAVLDGAEGRRLVVDRVDIGTPPERAEIDLRRPESRSRLLEGFYGVEGLDGETPAVWSAGTKSTVGLLLRPRAGRYRLELRGVAFGPVAPLAVGISVNGTQAGTATFSDAVEDVQVELPEGSLVDGVNIIELTYPKTGKPAESVKGSDDQRDLALSLHKLVITPAS